MPDPGSPWDARNAAARARGYRNYYDYRVHDYGRRPPGEDVVQEQRRRTRGHAGLTDLVRVINRSRNRPVEVSFQGLQRGADGRYTLILAVATFRDASRQNFYLRGRSASQENLVALRDNLARPGSRRVRRDQIPSGASGGGGGSIEGGGAMLPDSDDDVEDDEGEDEFNGSYYDDYDYDDDYYDEIPYVEAASIDVFSA